MVLINTLQCNISGVILDHPDVWRKRDHQRQVEIEVAAPTLLALTQAAIEMSKKLQDPFFTSAVAGSWMLNREGMNTAIMTSNFQSAVANSNTSN